MDKPPFSLTPDPNMLYLSGQHSECLMRLKYAIFSHKGGALLVSDTAGSGKTTVLARLKNDLNDYYAGRVRVVFIDHPTLAPIEMIGEISHQLGGEMQTSEKIRALNNLRDCLFTLYNENIKVVVIVDEGQMLKDRTDLLGELRILLNFCVADAFLLTFIFSGQKPLDTMLRDMPEFWQRLPVRFFLKNLDYNDSKSLIQFRLGKVGVRDDIFAEEAFEGVYSYSDGCPRIICSLADLCLIIGFAKGARRIGFVEVTTACRDMESSGDGFHYFAYLKSQQAGMTGKRLAPEHPASRPVGELQTADTDTRPGRDARPSVSTPQGEKVSAKTSAKKERSSGLAAPVAAIATVVCSACNTANPKVETHGSLETHGRASPLPFCTKCGAPLFRKCPVCSSLNDYDVHACSLCGADIDGEIQKQIEKVRDTLNAFDILGDGAGVWLNAKGIELDSGEQVLIIFPRSVMGREGPSVSGTSKDIRSAASTCCDGAPARRERQRDESKKNSCDFILTNRRIILSISDRIVETDIMHVDSCMVINVGRFLGRSHVLMLSFNGDMYRISLPHSARKARIIMDQLASFIRQVMVK